ncbi:unnamed protein product [Caretta caretta]
MVSTGDQDQLELPLSLAELSEALHLMPTNKYLGMDGLTMEFYSLFWDILSPDLVTIWAESLKSRHGLQVIMKAISLWLGSVLADVIHPDQTYTVLGRTIFDILYLVLDLLELGCRDGLLFAFLSLDQEVVFIRMDHGYLLGTLQAFGFGSQFVGFLQVLYAEVECLVRLNWTLTELDLGDLVWVEVCQAVYSAASSTRVNCVKSSGLVVGDEWQETHTDTAAKASWQLEWGDRLYFRHFTVHTAGVATLFSPYLRPGVLGFAKVVLGRLLHLLVRMEELVNLVNVYTPSSGPERLRFYQQASAFLSSLDPHECLVLGGDFNTTFKQRDCSGIEQCPAAANVLQEIVNCHSLVDIWLDHHPDDVSTVTFVQVEAHQLRHSRLDCIYLSHCHLSRTASSSIRPALFSNHHLATMMSSLWKEGPGPAYWHFNNSLVEDVGFVVSFQEFWLAWWW